VILGVIQMCTESQLNRIMKAMVECYKAVYGSDIVEIMLYGSYARGDYAEDSDIDIVALVHGSRIDLQEKLKVVWETSAQLGLENDIIVSSTVIPYDEFVRYKQMLPYYRNIAREGKKIG
ncbi:MAG: nucleotidyltransferase domain-containing protein, partial [Lachnospiraceae bacterium]